MANNLDQQIFCTYCKNTLLLKLNFRLYDPEPSNYGNRQRYFYRYDPCDVCKQTFKIKFLTTFDSRSGAQMIDFYKYRLEGCTLEDFSIDNIIEQTQKDSQIIRLIKKNDTTSYNNLSYYDKDINVYGMLIMI